MPVPKPDDYIQAMREQARWSPRAACDGDDPRLWDTRIKNYVTDVTEANRDAISTCNSLCPVRLECLSHAVRWDMRAGIWGGMTPEEREAWARGRTLAA